MSKLTRLLGAWVHLPGILILFIAAHFGHHVLAALLTPLLPFIRDEFNLDYTQAGILTSAFWFIYGVSHLPAGWLGDRIGRQIMAAIGISGLAFFGILVGLSTNYIMLLIFLALMGIAGGGYHPAAAPLISAATEPKSRGTALGLHQGGGNVSFFLGPLIAVGLASFLGIRRFRYKNNEHRNIRPFNKNSRLQRIHHRIYSIHNIIFNNDIFCLMDKKKRKIKKQLYYNKINHQTNPTQ